MLYLVPALLVVIASSVLLVFIVVAYFRTGVPTVVSAKAAQRLAAQVLAQRKAKRIFELGSGKGDFVIRLAQWLPETRVYGFEISPLPYLAAQLARLFSSARSRISFFLRDFRKVNLADADAVVFYLMIHANKKLAPKLEKELLPGTTVVSISFSVADWIPEQVLIADNFTKTRVLVFSMPPKHKKE